MNVTRESFSVALAAAVAFSVEIAAAAEPPFSVVAVTRKPSEPNPPVGAFATLGIPTVNASGVASFVAKPTPFNTFDTAVWRGVAGSIE